MSAIDVKNLVKKFHGQTVLHGIDLEVEQGEVVAIIGPSGSGKTTLLRSINLLEQPEGGTIRVGEITIDTGKSISQQKGLIRRAPACRLCFPELQPFPAPYGAGEHY
jgi:cystine transport system ATP-binding protein